MEAVHGLWNLREDRAYSLFMRILWCVIPALLGGCAKRESDQAQPTPARDPGSAVAAEPKPAPVVNPDEMIKLAYQEVAAPYAISAIKIRYVRPDGTMDPQYGEVQIETTKQRPTTPADDPKRPVGAPTPPMDPALAHDIIMAKCPLLTWRAAQPIARDEGPCGFMITRALARPRCTVAGVLASAKQAGAPSDALATIELTAPVTDEAPQTWRYSVVDAPRKIDFGHELVDTCDPVAEKP